MLLFARVRLNIVWVLLLTVFSTVSTSSVSRGQSLSDLARAAQPPFERYRGMALGGGLTFFDGKPYLLLHVAPQLQFGDWGFGIDGNIRISTENGALRKEDWDETYDYLRWINYVSYGFPGNDLYARLGGIDHGSIGNGVIVSDYSNNSSYDERRIGAIARLSYGAFGAEGLSSDLFKRGLIALRPFVRPFRLTPLVDTWLLRDLEIGATAVFDFDTNATRIIPNHEPFVTHYRSLTDSTVDSVVVNRDSARFATPFKTYGVDISTMLWKAEKTEGRLYGDYVKFEHYNDGVILGFRTSFFLTQSTFLDFRAERSFFRNHFLPNYYNTFYERDRFDDEARQQDYITKLTLLNDTTGGNGNGFRAGAFLDLAGDVQVRGNYLHLDNLAGKDWMELVLTLPHLGDMIYASATYTRKNIDGVSDLIALDERSLLRGIVSYRPFEWLIATAIVRWTFQKDDFGNVKTQTMVEPKFDFVFSF